MKASSHFGWTLFNAWAVFMNGELFFYTGDWWSIVIGGFSFVCWAFFLLRLLQDRRDSNVKFALAE
jgi:hypothetical protein